MSTCALRLSTSCGIPISFPDMSQIRGPQGGVKVGGLGERMLNDVVDSSGALLLSILDFGNPALVTMALSVEKPARGLWKLATSVLYGEPDEDDADSTRGSPASAKHQVGRDLV